MTVSTTRGWGRPRDGKKWHYFDRGYSLCNNWQTTEWDKLVHGVTSGTLHDCSTCVTRYARGLYDEDEPTTTNKTPNHDLEFLWIEALSARPVPKKKPETKRSKYRGVSWHVSGKWQANVKVKGQNYYLGIHETEKKAAQAYDSAVREHLGADGFDRLNFKEQPSTK